MCLPLWQTDLCLASLGTEKDLRQCVPFILIFVLCLLGTGHRVKRVSIGGTFGNPQLADLTDGLMDGWVDGWVRGRMDEGLMDSEITR